MSIEINDLAENIINDDSFFAASYGEINAFLNKHGDVVIKQDGHITDSEQMVIIRRDDFLSLVNYLSKEFDAFDEASNV